MSHGEPRSHGGLQYRVQGSGRPVLLLHPAFMHSGAFDGEVAALSGQMRMIRVDSPGHGATQGRKDAPTMDGVADALVGILDAEGIEDVDVLGISMGSLLGQDFARRHPDRVRSLTAVGGYEVTDPIAGKAQNGALLQMLPRLIFARPTFRRWVANESAATDHGRARIEELTQNFRLSSMLAMRGMEKVLNVDREDRLACPLLIVVGEHDIPVVIEAAKRWHAGSPESQWAELPGLGHCANLDDPAAVHAVWMAFLDGLAG